jgi:hypothetical protein
MKVRGYVRLLALAVLLIGQIWAGDTGSSSNQPSPVLTVSADKQALRPKALPAKRKMLARSVLSRDRNLKSWWDSSKSSGPDQGLARRKALRDLAKIQGIKIFKHQSELDGLEKEVVLDHLDLIPGIEMFLQLWAPDWLVLKELYSVRDGADIRDFAKPSDLQVKRYLFLDPQGVLKRNFTQLNANPLVLVDRDNYQRKFGRYIVQARSRQLLELYGIDLAIAIGLMGDGKLNLERHA